MTITNNQASITKQASNIKEPSIRHPFDLEERTLKFATRVIHTCKSLTSHVTNRELVSQVIRSSGSVGANYREANGAPTKKDFLHRISITQREAKEAHYWLQLLAEANPEASHAIAPLTQEAMELKKIFASIIDHSRSPVKLGN